jgi:hypothetical protein
MTRDVALTDFGAVGYLEYDSVLLGGGMTDFGIVREVSTTPGGILLPHYNVQDAGKQGIDSYAITSAEPTIKFLAGHIADPNLWFMIFHGATLNVSTPGTTGVVDEAIILTGDADSGNFFSLAHGVDLDNTVAVVVEDIAGGGATPYVEGTDYFFDYSDGKIARIDGGGITAGVAAYVTYTYKTYAGKYFEIFESVDAPEFGIRYTKPLKNGQNFRYQHDRALIKGTGSWDNAPPEGAPKYVSMEITISILKSTGGIYGDFGRVDIFTP